MTTASLKIGILGDYNPENVTHTATDAALEHATAHLSLTCEFQWVPTPLVASAGVSVLKTFSGLVATPGSPYASEAGMLQAIRYAREFKVPLIGTCGGMQHIILEYARNVIGLQDVAHAENNPYASRFVVSALTCVVKGKTLPIVLKAGSHARALYGADRIEEQYYCNFGLNSEYRQVLETGGLVVTGVDDDQEVRIVEILAHPFFMGTLFVPQVRSQPGTPHPLIVGLLTAACESRTSVSSLA